MKARSYVKVVRWKNTLTLTKTVPQKRTVNEQPQVETIAERRERENVEAIGGLRFAKRAVARSTLLRNVGQRIRTVLDAWMTDNLLQGLQENLELGISEQDGAAETHAPRGVWGSAIARQMAHRPVASNVGCSR